MKILRINEVLQRLGIKKTTLYRLIEKDAFPKPIKIGKVSLWEEGAINRVIEGYVQKGVA